jgi:predicted metal-binding protein
VAKVGIIRCQEQSNNCAGFSCFPAIRDKTGGFEGYDTVELVGFDTCGGCGRNKADKIVAKAKRLKEKGAEVIHLGSCLVMACPTKDLYVNSIREQVQIPVVEKTHPTHPPAAR